MIYKYNNKNIDIFRPAVLYFFQMEVRGMDDKNFELLEKLYIRMEEGFTRVDQRFEQIDQRFEQIDQRFEQIDQRFEQIDQRFEQMDQRFDHLEQRVGRLEQTVTRIEHDHGQKLQALFDGYQAHTEAIETLNSTVSQLKTTVEKHEVKLKIVR